MMTTYLNNLMVIGNKAEISDRIRSLIRGVIDLRNIGWLSHENSNVVQANEIPNKREGHSNGHQLPQDISVSNGICRDVVDDKGESGKPSKCLLHFNSSIYNRYFNLSIVVTPWNFYLFR